MAPWGSVGQKWLGKGKKKACRMLEIFSSSSKKFLETKVLPLDTYDLYSFSMLFTHKRKSLYLDL